VTTSTPLKRIREQRRANRKSGALNSSKYAARTHRDDQW
jgi:hypothetical protein